ncbi:MAG TPA: NUDIX domain-containing protein [Opitutaceae bacterium]|jgi:isopentenyldiphosphate isomerase|nr:NUDIX domain-containing protein [Opitutaceae bacterium]
MDANVKAGQNPEELFDVVDAQDRVVSQAPRREVHAKQLRHRAVHVLVFDEKGAVFLQKRSMGKDSCPGTWDSSCSGHLDAGEDYDAAAVRELREEIGLECAEKPERWLRLSASENTGMEFVWIYRMQSEGPFTLNEAEISEGAWFAPDEISEGIVKNPDAYAGSFRYFWPRVRDELP